MEHELGMDVSPDVERSVLSDAQTRSRVFVELNRVLEELWFGECPKVVPAGQRELNIPSDFDFECARDLESTLASVVGLLHRFDVRTTRRGYLGLFNPHPTFPSVVAETIASIFSCQLGSTSQCEVGVHIEGLLIKYFSDFRLLKPSSPHEFSIHAFTASIACDGIIITPLGSF